MYGEPGRFTSGTHRNPRTIALRPTATPVRIVPAGLCKAMTQVAEFVRIPKRGVIPTVETLTSSATSYGWRSGIRKNSEAWSDTDGRNSHEFRYELWMGVAEFVRIPNRGAIPTVETLTSSATVRAATKFQLPTMQVRRGELCAD